MFQPGQRFPGAVELAELDEQLGVERLGAIEQAVADADLIKQPSHVRQRVVGRLIVAAANSTNPSTLSSTAAHHDFCACAVSATSGPSVCLARSNRPR